MRILEATSVSNYINQLPENRKQAVFKELYETISLRKTNLPDGYESFLSYGMPENLFAFLMKSTRMAIM